MWIAASHETRDSPFLSPSRTLSNLSPMLYSNSDIPSNYPTQQSIIKKRRRRRRSLYDDNDSTVPLGSGSGFVWDKKGHIVTNYHVVRNARVAQVAILTDGNNKQVKKIAAAAAAAASSASSGSTTTSNIVPYSSMKPTGVSSGSSPAGTVRSVFKAQVVGVDPSKDVAVLKVDAPPELLYPITVGTSSGLRVGQQSLAIGNPFGLDHTLTMGIISGIGREVKSPIGRPITNGTYVFFS